MSTAKENYIDYQCITNVIGFIMKSTINNMQLFLFKITSFIHILIEMSYWKSCQYSRWEPRVVKYMLGSYVYIQPSMPHDLVCLITSKKLDWGLVEIFPHQSTEGRAQGCGCFAHVHGMEHLEGEKSNDFPRSPGAA